ncbi:hypothetical protein EW146_g9 [Bondarzewia mesenterica]|uniref:Uncharacterized protein n=1 Tax=Bondarzewia mesenterica TaxID=1095465 RepID=A0A4S4M8S2_9AGAM|nr:hypothetical protein EW146_g9 [Bondarzewia mesenterica]
MATVDWAAHAKEEAIAYEGVFYPENAITWHENIVKQYAATTGGSEVSIRASAHRTKSYDEEEHITVKMRTADGRKVKVQINGVQTDYLHVYTGRGNQAGPLIDPPARG